VVWKGF